MRIRLFNAFASNNSGSYTIVGSFRDEATAEEVALLLQRACDAHSAWYEEHNDEQHGESPLDSFAQREGLPGDKPGAGRTGPSTGRSPASSRRAARWSSTRHTR
jgi:hypothetical protein